MDFAKEHFRHQNVRDITTADVRRFLTHVQTAGRKRQNHTSPEARAKVSGEATQSKHLRVLHSCLAAAIEEGLASVNVASFKTQRPKVSRANPSYFTNEELAKLREAYIGKDFEPVYRAMLRLAAATGMRQGELIALEVEGR